MNQNNGILIMTDAKKALQDSVDQMIEEEQFLNKQLTVSTIDYSEAIRHLLRLAKGDSSGSKAAAQVLLSLYNGHEWHMNLTDLCSLDTEHFQSALIAIRGRVILLKEPQDVISEGDKQFKRLWDDWYSVLHVTQRYDDAE